MKSFFVLAFALVFQISTAALVPPSTYSCDSKHGCTREAPLGEPGATAMSYGKCVLVCKADAMFWPKLNPKDENSIHMTIKHQYFMPEKISFANIGDFDQSELAVEYLDSAINEHKQWLENKMWQNSEVTEYDTKVDIRITLDSLSTELLKDTNEEYSITVSYDIDADTVTADINAPTYFGARNALETLFQAMEFDDLPNGGFLMLSDWSVSDEPVYRHRGIMIDTSRNYMELDVLKRILDGMAASKLNVFHWHFSDSHSFPIELKTPPVDQMLQYGAYDAKSVYTEGMIAELIEHATKRGVRVIPELDQPSHIGAGWQFPEAEGMTVCVNEESWYKYCLEPPCGQLDPTHDGLIDMLGLIYGDLDDLFHYDSFHMGADEVHMGCWKHSIELPTAKNGLPLPGDEPYYELWADFQANSSAKLREVSSPANDDLEVIIWTSGLTDKNHIQLISDQNYVVQIWTDSKDAQIDVLVENNIPMIFSNYDGLYLDCGFRSWTTPMPGWCDPYKGWQLFYQNDPIQIIRDRGFTEIPEEDLRQLVLGEEAPMWSEMVDSALVEAKVFPRAAAMAERLWSDPDLDVSEVEQRIDNHRLRLLQRGVRTDKLQPDWCRLNGWQCIGVPEGYIPPGL